MEVTSFNFLYMLEMLLPAIGLCIPLKKRKHGMGKAMAIIIVGTCLLGVLPIFYIKYYGTEMQQGILWVESVILMFVWFVLIWAILIFSIYFCTESSIYEAMYIFALSYGVEHILLYSGSRGTFYKWNHRKQTSACIHSVSCRLFSSGVFLVCKRNRV